jgi:UDP:flavonoid glycosyltransferase YjiC (YdhE family)
MARFLFATISAAGHIAPGLGIARALVSRGHEVVWYTGRRYQTSVERAGARFAPMLAAHEIDDGALDAEFPGRAELRGGLPQLIFDMKHLFIDPIPSYVEDLERIASEQDFDGYVSDVGFVAMNLFCEREGLRHTSYGVSALPFPSRDAAPFGLALRPRADVLGRLRNAVLHFVFEHVIFRGINQHYAATRRSLGMPEKRTGSFFADARGLDSYLQASVPGFEYPRSDLPAGVKFIGPFLPPIEPFVAPSWWDELDGSLPVVHVTQGTVAMDSTQLIGPALEALADEDVLVVATTGGRPVSELGPLPRNARVAEFVPYAHLLPRTSVMITNAGFGGVQLALAHGIPLVAAGGSEDKPEVAARIAWTGAGIDLRTATPTARDIREAVRTVLREPRYRARARALQDETAVYDAPSLAAEAIERLLPTRDNVRALVSAVGTQVPGSFDRTCLLPSTNCPQP